MKITGTLGIAVAASSTVMAEPVSDAALAAQSQLVVKAGAR